MRFFSTILVAATACCSSAFTVKNSIRAASAIGAAPVDRDAVADSATDFSSDRRSVLTAAASAVSAAALMSVAAPQPASARLEAVDAVRRRRGRPVLRPQRAVRRRRRRAAVG